MTCTPDSAARATFPNCVPVLSDGWVLLRAHSPADAPGIVEQCADPTSIRWTTVPVPYGLDDARTWLAQIARDWESDSAPRLWAITSAADPDTFLGSIDVRPQGAGIATIGFGLHPSGRDRHLMSGAVRLVTRWWFDQGGVRMIWEANRGNFASWRVAHACGFTFHGILPQHLDHRGEPVDAYYGSVGRDDDLYHPVRPWHETPVLEAEQVRLRPWRDADIAAVPESDSTPQHFVPPGSIPTRDTFAPWLLRRRERQMTGMVVDWCIAERAGDVAVGNVLLILDRHEPGAAELGYVLFEPSRGRGLATTAARLATEFGLRSREDGGLGVRRILAVTVGDNTGSSRVLETLGFTEWGRQERATVRVDDSFDDTIHWVRFRD